jgi:hypothetical protein
MNVIAEISQLQFCQWVPWRDRSKLLRDDGPWLGVYPWAHFRRPPNQSVKPYPFLPRQVIYIGEAKNIDRRAHEEGAVRQTIGDARPFTVGPGSAKSQSGHFGSVRYCLSEDLPMAPSCGHRRLAPLCSFATQSQKRFHCP